MCSSIVEYVLNQCIIIAMPIHRELGLDDAEFYRGSVDPRLP
jgi:hypothetical protein